MANYNVDIAVAIKNARALKQFNKDVKQTSNFVDDVNLKIRRASNAYEKSLNTLSSSLQKTKVNINKAAVGTDAFRKSAQNLVRAEKSLNKELQLKNKLLEQLRKNEDQLGVAQSSSSNRVRRNVAESRRSRISSKFKTLDTPTPSIDLRNRVRGNLRQSRISRFGSGFADFNQNFEQRIAQRNQAEFQRNQIEIKNRLRRNINQSKFSRFGSGFANFSQTVDSSIAAQNQRAIKTNVLRNIRETQRSRIGGGFRSLSLSGQTSPVGEKIARALENEKKLVKEVEAIRGRASKKRAANTKRQLTLEKRSNGFVKKAIQEETALRKKAEAEANKLAQKRRERRQKLGSTASSAIIGGAFPLLFGQTGAAAVGGGLGGAAGGLVGGQFGFALSILGTAIGSAIDKNEKFRQSLAVLNLQFSTTSGSTQILAADVDKLAKRLSITKEEAIAALSAFKEFGSSSVAKSLVSIFGTDSAAFDTLASTNRQAALAKQIFATRKEIGNQVARQLLQQNLVNDSSVVELALAEAKAKAANDEAIAKAKVVTLTDMLAASAATQAGRPIDPQIFGQERGQKIQEEFEKGKQKRIEDFKQSLNEVRELLGLVNEAQGQYGQSGSLALSSITDKVKDLQDEMKKLANPIYMVMSLSNTMATSFEDSFKGIIKGTMTVADAFRNMLNRIADHFLDTAARMLANQFQQGLLGLFGNLFTGGFTAPAAFVAAPGTFGTNIPSGANLLPGSFANGGRPPVGKPSIVGERGPELFTPGVSGTITPNEMLGGSTNIVVNVDASGSNVEGDEDEGRALGIALSAAIETELIKQKRPGGLLA